MTASVFTQFLLLFKKNFQTCISRNKVSFLKEIICPLLVTFLLLWIRGYIKSDLRESYSFDKIELKSWPPGLVPETENAGGNAEFMLLYNNNGDSKIDDLVDSTITYMDENAVKWLSYEEYRNKSEIMKIDQNR